MRDLNGTSALSNLSPTSSASLLTSLPLVTDTYGRVVAQPQVVEREGEVGFEWLITWNPPRLGVQRVQCLCFAAVMSASLSDNSTQTLASMSLPHCITFVIVPDPPPSWSPSSLALAPLRIVMGTSVTLLLQASDDNPDDSIRLESLTSPANMPSFVQIAAGMEMSLQLSLNESHSFSVDNSLASSSPSMIISGPPIAPSWRPVPTVSALLSFSPQLGDGGQNITLCFKALDSAGQAATGSVSQEQAAMGAGLCVQVMVVSCIYK